MQNAARFLLPLLLAGAAQAAGLRDQLGMFFTFGPQDSIVALTRKSSIELEVEVMDPATSAHRTLSEDVGSKPIAKILAQARSEGVPVTSMLPEDSSGAGAAAPGPDEAAPKAKAEPAVRDRSEKSEKPGRTMSGQRKNRVWYMANQVPLSTYVYGVSIPLALDVSSVRVQAATPLLVAPVAFGAHFWFAKNHEFEDSHFYGTQYLSYASLYASYALPFSLIDWDSNPFRIASFVSLAAYPLGIWGGYKLGDAYVDLPGRITTQANFALGFGILGFFTPFLYYEHLDAHNEAIVRLGLGQSVAFATLGHFLAAYYRTGENVPAGVSTGILNHAALGAGLGLEVAALADAKSLRPWLGAGLAGGTLGFMEGLYFLRNSYDTKERGYYNGLGTAAGMAMGGGVLILVSGAHLSDYAAKVTTVSLIETGALLGYAVTDWLTSGMEERTSQRPDSWTDRLAVNLFPIPEPEVVNRDIHYRYRIPGVSYSF